MEHLVCHVGPAKLRSSNRRSQELSRAWPASGYDLMARNCNHFSEALCQRLCGQGIPSWVTPGSCYSKESFVMPSLNLPHSRGPGRRDLVAQEPPRRPRERRAQRRGRGCRAGRRPCARGGRRGPGGGGAGGTEHGGGAVGRNRLEPWLKQAVGINFMLIGCC